MDAIQQLSSCTVVLPMEDIDTDQIIPARFLTTTTKTGLGRHLFSYWRYNPDGSDKTEFVLNSSNVADCQILVAGNNFGCGSSREHAPWALLDFGIRCVIAPSFADIFYNNCIKNGILPVSLPETDVDRLMDDAGRGANATLTVDLENQVITGSDGASVAFDVDPLDKHCLLNDIDDIAQTLEKAEKIDDFEARQKEAQPWLYS